MAYRIEYFKALDLVGSAECAEPLDRAAEIVREGAVAMGAWVLRIIDMDAGGVEVWSEDTEIDAI